MKNKGVVLPTVIFLMIVMVLILIALSRLGLTNILTTSQAGERSESRIAADSGIDAALAYMNEGTVTCPSGSGTVIAETNLENSGERVTYTVTGEPSPIDSDDCFLTSTGRVYKPASSTTPDEERSINAIVTQRTNYLYSLQAGTGGMHFYEVPASATINGDLYSQGTVHLTNSILGTGMGSAGIYASGYKEVTGYDSFGSTNKCSFFLETDTNKTRISGNTYARYDGCWLAGGTERYNADTDIYDVNVPIIELPDVNKDAVLASITTPTEIKRNCSELETATPLAAHPINAAHYPDKGDNTAGGCNATLVNGKSYDLLGSAHIRGNLTLSNNTITNTSGGPAYIFVEGKINITGDFTVGGTQPILFVGYDADSNDTIAGPHAIRIGSKKNVSARGSFLAVNGSIYFAPEVNLSIGALAGETVVVHVIGGTANLSFDLSALQNFPVADSPWRIDQYLNN